MTYDQVWWPILRICALHLTHPKCTHTAVKIHTHREHTPGAVGSHLCCGARGAVGGSVPCSRAPQSWYWGWRERCTFTPPTYNSCQTWDSNSQPLGYESDSLTIRPRLPFYIYIYIYTHTHVYIYLLHYLLCLGYFCKNNVFDLQHVLKVYLCLTASSLLSQMDNMRCHYSVFYPSNFFLMSS